MTFVLAAGSSLAVGAQPERDQDGTVLVHEVNPGDTLIKICSQYRGQTNHYSLDELLQEIRRENNLKTNLLNIGQELRIPVAEMETPTQVQDPVASGNEVRGIYLTGPACGVSSVWRRVDNFIAAGGNAVIFDAKDIDGGVSFYSGNVLASWGKGRSRPVISSLPEMMERFDRRGLYVVARLAVFLDGELGKRRPDLALQGPDKDPWGERGCVWMNAGQPEVRQYNIDLARELAAAGVDEIQFDYMRYPTNGWQENWTHDGEGDLEASARSRREAIITFLTEARTVLEPLGVKISADLYGIMAWGRMVDLALTGQHVPTIASLVDIICPMIYPSHFGPGFEGRQRPADDPDYFIAEGTRRFLELAAGQAEIRPWLQAFPYRVSNYDSGYIETQIIAARLAGGSGWSLWNPACRYTVALQIMPSLCNDNILDPAATGTQLAAGLKASPVPSENPISALELPAEPEPRGPAALTGSLLAPVPVPKKGPIKQDDP